MWTLVYTVFPSRTESLDEQVERAVVSEDRGFRDVFVIWEAGVALANAMVFRRTIATMDGPLDVMALAAVCSAPERRGKGLGRLVVAEAFREVDTGAYPVSLFQTGVPNFYEKLGARLVDNGFVNSRYNPTDKHGSPDAPWWEPYAMIYPATYDWPSGEIDLLGAGY